MSDSVSLEHPNTQEITRVPDPQIFALEFKKNGGKFYPAFIAAGYSETTARAGMAALSAKLKSALLEEHVHIAKNYSPEQRAEVIRGALLANVALGKDAAVQSLKLLGQDKDVGMFSADSQVGVIILQAPQNQVFTDLPLPTPQDVIESD